MTTRLDASTRTIAVATLCVACASSPPRSEAAHRGEPGRVECAPYAAVPETLLGPGWFLLFGEIHGVREFPAFFGESACHVAASGRPLTVALELPGSEQLAVDAYLASGGSPADQAALLATPFWTRAYQDGRSSEAMADLLRRLHRLRAAGFRLEVFLFDVERPGPDRDARMAERLIAYQRAHPSAGILVLTGNLHARTAPGAPWDAAWRPMGWFLREAGARVEALDCSGPKGTAWTCESDAPEGCGTRTVGTAPIVGQQALPAISLAGVPTPEGFAGHYLTTSITSSLPAKAVAGSR